MNDYFYVYKNVYPFHIHTTCEYITFNHFLKPVFPIAKSQINFFYKKFAVKLLRLKFCIIQRKPYENMMSGCWGMLKKHESVCKQASKKLVDTITQERKKIKTLGFLRSICMVSRTNWLDFGEVWTRKWWFLRKNT